MSDLWNGRPAWKVLVHTSLGDSKILLSQIRSMTMSNGLRRDGEIQLMDGRVLSVCDFALDETARRIFFLCGISITVEDALSELTETIIAECTKSE